MHACSQFSSVQSTRSSSNLAPSRRGAAELIIKPWPLEHAVVPLRSVLQSPLEHLLSLAADFGSQHLWQPMMAASQGKARGILMWKLRMKIGAAIVRANAMLLMDRVAHTGGVMRLACSRQSRAESQFFRGGDPAEATYAAHRLQRNAASMGGAVIGVWVS